MVNINVEKLESNVVFCVGGMSGVSKEKKKPYTMLHCIQKSHNPNFQGLELNSVFLPDQFEIPVNEYISFDLAFIGGRFVPCDFIINK